MTSRSLAPRDFLFLAICLTGWACNFIAIRYSVVDLSVTTALLARFLIVSAVLLPFIKRPKGPALMQVVKLSLVLVVGHFGLLFWSLQVTNTVGGISVFIQLGPAFSVLLAWLLLGEVPGIRRIIGLVIGFLGVVILFYDPALIDSQTALAIATGSAFFLGLYFVLIRQAKDLSAIDIIGWTSIVGIPLMAIGTQIEGVNPVQELMSASPSALVGVLYTAVISSILAHGLWAWLLKQHEVSLLAPMTLSVPILTVALSAAIYGEVISLRFFAATFCILAGGWFILRSPPVQARLKDAP